MVVLPLATCRDDGRRFFDGTFVFFRGAVLTKELVGSKSDKFLSRFDTFYEFADARKLGRIGCGNPLRLCRHLRLQKAKKAK